MLERIKKDQEEPYQGGKSIFYQRVKHIRQEQKMTKQKATWTFEGLPGEYLQSLPSRKWGWIGESSVSFRLPRFRKPPVSFRRPTEERNIALLED